jgi:alkylation response protein AidB-like acyl-CoA dehydrogenase
MAAKMFKGAEFLVTVATKDDVFSPEDFTEEQRQIASTAQQFVEDEVLPRAARLERHEAGVASALMRKAGEAGLLMIDAPEAYGGLELDKATSILAAEKVAWAGDFSVSYSAHTGIGTLPLVYYGTEAQKEKYLTRIVSGEWSAAYCLTEPEAGSDAMGGKATATLSPDGKHYLLEGTKQFITNGGFADLFTVFAKVDRKHFTAFLVERTFPGVTVGPEEKKLGIKGSSTTSVILEGAQVPVENVLGEIGKGHKIAFNVLNVGRFKLGAAVLGASKMSFGTGVGYALQRKQFGVPIASFGALQEKFADRAADIFASESLVYRLAGLLDARLATIPRDAPRYYEAYQQGIEEHALECAIAKVFCSEVLADVVDDVVQVHGGYGFIQEYAAEKQYRDERINRIFEGTNEINRLLVPTTILRRAMKGELPLQREAQKAMDALTSPAPGGADPSVPFAAEKEALAGLKRTFLLVAGAAVQRHGEALKHEQEVLLALADVAIQVFAAESAVLRAEKISPSLPEARRAAVGAAVRIHTFAAAEKAGSAARRAAFYVAEGDPLAVLLGGIRRFTRYDATGLLAAKRRLAGEVLEAGKYPL